MARMQLVYRSLAVEPPSTRGLERLLEVVRRRNALEGLTGLLVNDQCGFVQWLERPPDGLARVRASIQRFTKRWSSMGSLPAKSMPALTVPRCC